MTTEQKEKILKKVKKAAGIPETVTDEITKVMST